MKMTLAPCILMALALAGCDKGNANTTPPEPTRPGATGETEAELVPNLQAQPGDTTTCPYSGRPFVVEAVHPKVDYEGESYWVCSEDAAQKIRENPDEYLADFQG